MDKYSEIERFIKSQPQIDIKQYLSQDIIDALKKELQIKRECEKIDRIEREQNEQSF
jgi:hypothetical protein